MRIIKEKTLINCCKISKYKPAAESLKAWLFEVKYSTWDNTNELKSKYRNANEEQLALADRKYISSVYFHTLFLYSITKNRKYRIYQQRENNDENEVELGSYLKDIFESYYSEFILNFGGAEELMAGLGD